MNKKIDQPNNDGNNVRDHSFFGELKKEEMEEIDLDTDADSYQKGQKIFIEGNRPLGLYYINKGKIKIYKDGFNGKEQIVRLAKDGDILGYRSLISGENYSASAEALEDSMICLIPKNVFFNILHRNQNLMIRVMQLLSNDLKLAENKVTELSQKTVRERTAEALLMLKETYGFEKDNTTLAVALSREDLANIVDTATETLIRILSSFKEEKIIDLSGKKIMIMDMPRLLYVAALEE